MECTRIVFPEADAVRVEPAPVADTPLDDDEVLIRAEASVISSGTELAHLSGSEFGSGFPARPGYGMVGRIEAHGAGVADFATGQRVFCAGKHASLQRFRHRQGHQWGHLFPVPEALDPVDACVGCLAQIALTAPAITDLRLGERVAVFGLGMVGILAARLYQLRGARVLGVDPVASRCRLAERVGIAETCDAPPAEQVAAVRAWGGDGAAVCCDASGITPAVTNAIAATADLGQVVLLGSTRAPWQTDLTPLLYDIHRRGLVVRGAHMWRFPVTGDRTIATTVEWNFATVFEQIASGALRVRELVSHVIRPDQAPEAYAGLRDDPEHWTGVVIDWRDA